jgi:hypothetical protein
MSSLSAAAAASAGRGEALSSEAAASSSTLPSGSVILPLRPQFRNFEAQHARNYLTHAWGIDEWPRRAPEPVFEVCEVLAEAIKGEYKESSPDAVQGAIKKQYSLSTQAGVGKERFLPLSPSSSRPGNSPSQSSAERGNAIDGAACIIASYPSISRLPIEPLLVKVAPSSPSPSSTSPKCTARIEGDKGRIVFIRGDASPATAARSIIAASKEELSPSKRNYRVPDWVLARLKE